MTSEALQNPYFVRLYCKNIDKTHSLTEPNDKIQSHGNYFFKKGGGTTLEKGGEPTPCSPPPLNPPLLFDMQYYYITRTLLLFDNITRGSRLIYRYFTQVCKGKIGEKQMHTTHNQLHQASIRTEFNYEMIYEMS